MKQGILIYAHNSRVIDYLRLAVISAGLAKKHLKKPVSLVTDESTLAWGIESGLEKYFDEIFDKIIITEKPELGNQRNIYDGEIKETIPFFNNNRSSSYDLTPYDQTLLIDCDYFVQSDVLNNYWNFDLAISSSIADISNQDRIGYYDKYISDTGIKLFWATTFIFTKNEKSKLFFDLLGKIKEAYRDYSDIYRFNPSIYRNDISFSVTKHVLDGFSTSDIETLPPVLTALDRDILIDIDSRGNFKFLISNDYFSKYVLASIKDLDLHIMNKQSVTRHFNKLIELI